MDEIDSKKKGNMNNIEYIILRNRKKTKNISQEKQNLFLNGKKPLLKEGNFFLQNKKLTQEGILINKAEYKRKMQQIQQLENMLKDLENTDKNLDEEIKNLKIDEEKLKEEEKNKENEETDLKQELEDEKIANEERKMEYRLLLLQKEMINMNQNNNNINNNLNNNINNNDNINNNLNNNINNNNNNNNLNNNNNDESVNILVHSYISNNSLNSDININGENNNINLNNNNEGEVNNSLLALNNNNIIESNINNNINLNNNVNNNLDNNNDLNDNPFLNINQPINNNNSNPFDDIPNQPINNNMNNFNLMNSDNNNFNPNLININLPNNNFINQENQNMIFPIFPSSSNNINSSLNIIKSNFLDEDGDFGEAMTFQQIDNLPIINFPKKENYDEKCPLCEFPFYFNDRVTKLENCQHTFHKECLGNFLMHKKASKCPVCKISII